MAEANDTPTCSMCGNGFEQRKGQGRPFQKCPDCSAKPTYQRKQYAPRQCQWCAEEFVPLRVDTRFCSRRCIQRDADAGRAGRVRTGKRTTRPANCRVCGDRFDSYASTGAPGGWTECCSDRCGRLARRIRTGSILRSYRVKAVRHRGQCVECGRPYTKSHPSQERCSAKCRAVLWAWTPKKKTCPECACSYTQTKRWQQTCSDECSESARRKAASAARVKRRLRVRSGPRDAIDPLKVLARDGWKCQICGVPTPKRLRGTYEPNAPEVDHIIPLAVGGTHTWGNVQCACRECNGKKGATIRGQLGLPLAA